MIMKYEPYIAKDLGELWDELAGWVISAPKFRDPGGYFPGQSLQTELTGLNESLKLLRKKLGEERYAKLVELSDRMRAHFEADPEDENGEAVKGREVARQMEDIIREMRKRKRANDA